MTSLDRLESEKKGLRKSEVLTPPRDIVGHVSIMKVATSSRANYSASLAGDGVGMGWFGSIGTQLPGFAMCTSMH